MMGWVEQKTGLLTELDGHLAVQAVLEGRAAGRWFACGDSQLLWTGHRVYLGNPQSGAIAFADWLRRVALPQAEGGLIFYCPQPGWEAALTEGLAGHLVYETRHAQYALRQRRFCAAELTQPGYELRMVDADLMAQTGLLGIDALAEELCSERSSVADFLAHSFGFVLLHQSAIVGWCLSEYNCSLGCEIGIATTEQHQRRGLATWMTTAFLEEAEQRGVAQVGWHCFARNLPSAATALRVGFEKVREVDVTVVELSPQ